MRRRSSVALIIVMLAALVPSASLAAPAAKPVDAVTAITWTAQGGSSPGVCSTSVTIEYTVAKGPTRWYDIWIRQAGGRITGLSNKVERDGSVTASFTFVDYLDVAEGWTPGLAYVEVKLYDSKFVNVLATAETPSYTFSGTEACPSDTDLGTFIAP